LNIVLIVPTFNPKPRWHEWLDAYAAQTLKPVRAMVIDSYSTDDSVHLATEYGFEVITIKKEEFGHGKTRQYALSLMADADIVIYMTQDAILHEPCALEKLVAPFFKDASIGAVYGRQLPHIGADLLEAHARLFNYPAQSQIKSKADIPRLGIKTAFCSNSFAAYRVSTLQKIGGFPQHITFGEDMYVAAKMILADFKIMYAADALCRHSHHYSLKEEFKRAFEVGAFHAREAWLLEIFGKPEGEGGRYIVSEIKYVLNKNPVYLCYVFIKILAKLFGYKLGLLEHFFQMR
jgi:rhamnosyltransferase